LREKPDEVYSACSTYGEMGSAYGTELELKTLKERDHLRNYALIES
jgi:hypothetical protein